MTKEQQQVYAFMMEAKQPVFITPRIPEPEQRMLRANLVYEEALELIEALGFELESKPKLKKCKEPDLVLIADGLADLHYVAYCGTGLACGIDMEPVFEEVHRSNMTKFIDGTFRADGKYLKGPNYSKPDIKSILGL